MRLLLAGLRDDLDQELAAAAQHDQRLLDEHGRRLVDSAPSRVEKRRHRLEPLQPPPRRCRGAASALRDSTA